MGALKVKNPANGLWELAGVPGPAGLDGVTGSTGPTGSPGTNVLIVGNFGDTKTPSDLPSSGSIPAGWDDAGAPARQMILGEALLYNPADELDPLFGRLYEYVGTSLVVEGWIDAGALAGPMGGTGPQGDLGPTGPTGPSFAPTPSAIIPGVLLPGWTGEASFCVSDTMVTMTLINMKRSTQHNDGQMKILDYPPGVPAPWKNLHTINHGMAVKGNGYIDLVTPSWALIIARTDYVSLGIMSNAPDWTTNQAINVTMSWSRYPLGSGGGGGATGPASPIALDDLTDADTTTTAPADGDVLTFDGAALQWVPEAPAAGGGGGDEVLVDPTWEAVIVEGAPMGDVRYRATTLGFNAFSADSGVSVGHTADSGVSGVAVGWGAVAQADAGGAVAVGQGANVGRDAEGSIAVGVGASVQDARGIAIGSLASVPATHIGSVAIGMSSAGIGATTTAASQIMLGVNHDVVIPGPSLTVGGVPVVLSTQLEALEVRIRELEARLA